LIEAILSGFLLTFFHSNLNINKRAKFNRAKKGNMEKVIIEVFSDYV